MSSASDISFLPTAQGKTTWWSATALRDCAIHTKLPQPEMREGLLILRLVGALKNTKHVFMTEIVYYINKTYQFVSYSANTSSKMACSSSKFIDH